jgi:hypothetical protein
MPSDADSVSVLYLCDRTWSLRALSPRSRRNRQQIAYVYFEDEPRRRSAAKLLSVQILPRTSRTPNAIKSNQSGNSCIAPLSLAMSETTVLTAYILWEARRQCVTAVPEWPFRCATDRGEHRQAAGAIPQVLNALQSC